LIEDDTAAGLVLAAPGIEVFVVPVALGTVQDSDVFPAPVLTADLATRVLAVVWALFVDAGLVDVCLCPSGAELWLFRPSAMSAGLILRVGLGFDIFSATLRVIVFVGAVPELGAVGLECCKLTPPATVLPEATVPTVRVSTDSAAGL
jgi:hypothetical protein